VSPYMIPDNPVPKSPLGSWHWDDPHNEIAVLKAEVNDLQRRIAELENENEQLRDLMEPGFLAVFDESSVP